MDRFIQSVPKISWRYQLLKTETRGPMEKPEPNMPQYVEKEQDNNLTKQKQCFQTGQKKGDELLFPVTFHRKSPKYPLWTPEEPPY